MIKDILGIKNESFDKFLEFCEKSISNKILDFCHIKSIPQNLNTLIQEFLIEQYNLNKNGIGNSNLEVTSASDNGQTVNFKNVGGVGAMSSNVDEFLERNLTTLVAYRKLRW